MRERWQLNFTEQLSKLFIKMCNEYHVLAMCAVIGITLIVSLFDYIVLLLFIIVNYFYDLQIL